MLLRWTTDARLQKLKLGLKKNNANLLSGGKAEGGGGWLVGCFKAYLKFRAIFSKTPVCVSVSSAAYLYPPCALISTPNR